MPFAFFSIPAAARPDVAAELNAFLRSHRVLRVTQQWHEKEGAWAFSVEYVDGPGNSSTCSPASDKVDYKETLPPEQFELFARLRTLRKTIAEREGTPVFAVFSNAQLAEIVQRGCQSTAELRAISGVGEARVAKYGAEVLEVLKGGTKPS
ncbi:HRDC domain-containing protein [Prosthecobacter debontii]|uniref:HRDC domain-containing protein n=1 Tax=Prosthecobacter debontii TaxID=48467 RepID=A0A1T4YH66_9BACT|nr:HRDC domain-containing protein [Prosthecobacter debontii]SKB01167.1 HRDC domain-containing protein [Prosthecobacter debontii]